MHIDKIILQLNEISSELAKIRENENKKEIDFNFKYIKAIGNKYSIRNHILIEQDEYTRDLYITALMLLVLEDENKDTRLENILFLSRIVSSFNKEYDLEDCIIKSQKIKSDFWDNFYSNITNDLANCFILDALVISQISHNSIDIDKISNIIQLFDIDNEKLECLSNVAISILQQNEKGFIKSICDGYKPYHNYLIGYFRNLKYNAISNDINSIKQIEGNILIINAEIRDFKDTLDLDTFSANEMEFYNCNFQKMHSIKSNHKAIKFNRCCFKDCDIKTYSLFFIERLNISNSEIINCESTDALIESNECLINNCKFNKCTAWGKFIKSKYGSISNTRFKECKYKSWLDLRYCCNSDINIWISIEDGQISNCKVIY